MDDLDDMIGEETVVAEEAPQTEVEEATPETPVAEVEEAPAAEEPAEPAAEAPVQSEAEKGLLGSLTALRQEMRELKAAQAPKAEPIPIPDVFEDPKGYQQSIQQTFQAQIQNERLNTSEAFARDKHGDGVVNEARDAFLNSADPATRQQILASPMPYEAVVKWHNQQKFAQQVGPDPAAFLARQKEEWRREFEAEMVAKQATPMAKAPSLAGETSIGGRTSPVAPTLTPLDDLLS